jgi:hypothetical protein
MALSYVKYTGDGTTKNFSVTFQYIAAADVSVTVNGVAAPFTWLNESLIQITTAPASGALVDIRRSTAKSGALVDFEDASTLTSTDLDTLTNQLLYLSQEAFDTTQDALFIPGGQNAFDARNSRIINLADPINPQDAVTKSWLLSTTAGGVIAAAASAAAASASAADAAANASAVVAALTDADAARDAAIAARDAAIAARDAAVAAAASAGALGEYDTYALAKAATIPSTANFLRTKSYALGRPNSGSAYQKVASNPGIAEPAAFQSADGAWWLMNEPAPTPRKFGALGDGSTNDVAAVQLAINLVAAMGTGTLWFDTKNYVIGGAVQTGKIYLLEWKDGVSLEGPGGLKLADNTNVLAAKFTATFSGTTMTIASVITPGSVTGQIFLNGTGIPVALQISSQLTGSGLAVGATFQVDQPCGTIASPVTICANKRFVEMLGNTAGSLNNVRCGIQFDYNGPNNCASQSIWSWNSVISIYAGSNITFDGARFLRNTGSNTICLGTPLQAAPLTISNVVITKCLFENEGNRLNTASLDYSSIYSYCDGLRVLNCTFRLGASVNGCPWEVYGQNILVSGNSVSGYFNTANICAIANQVTQNVLFIGNVIQDCSVGFTLWTIATTSKLIGISIVDNNLSYLVGSPGGPYFVNGIGQVIFNSVLRNIKITGNTAENLDISDTTRTTDCISLQCAAGVKISNNILYGFPGRGIYCVSELGGVYEITHNEMSWVGYGGTVGGNQRTGIWLESSNLGGTMDTVIVEGNSISTQGSYALTYGVWSALNANDGYVGGNVVFGATTKMVWTGTGVAGVAYTLPKSSGFVDAASNTPCTYMKTKEGLVHVEGVMDTGTISGATTFATLPVGFRPASQLLVMAYNMTTDLSQALMLQSTGVITNRAGVSTGNRVSFSFNFKAA